MLGVFATEPSADGFQRVMVSAVDGFHDWVKQALPLGVVVWDNDITAYPLLKPTPSDTAGFQEVKRLVVGVVKNGLSGVKVRGYDRFPGAPAAFVARPVVAVLIVKNSQG